MTGDLYKELEWRGLIHQTTHKPELSAHLLSGSRYCYAGFDPTANSLTLGNLVTLMMLLHCQRMGHHPVIVIGGATGLIGDPSGKSTERTLLSKEEVDANIQGQKRIYERLFSLGPYTILNNIDWLIQLTYLDVLRTIGKHFSINSMIQRDSVKDRLEKREQGISYTEFSYMILQSYDFYYLAKEHNVSVQLGGSDQYGNIISGCDLIKRLLPTTPAFGITCPLLTKADGTKFGKTEQGAIWLTQEKTSAYSLYQFLLNTEDSQVEKLLKQLTLLKKEEINDVMNQHEGKKELRLAQKTLAKELVTLLHGEEQFKQALQASTALFTGEFEALNLEVLSEILATMPSSSCSNQTTKLSEQGIPIVEALLLTTLVQSKREAREFLAKGAIWANGKVKSEQDLIKTHDLLHQRFLIIRRGKKSWYLLEFC